MFFVCEEIDSTDGNSNAGLSEALGDQNIHTLQNQVEYTLFLNRSAGFLEGLKCCTSMLVYMYIGQWRFEPVGLDEETAEGRI